MVEYQLFKIVPVELLCVPELSIPTLDMTHDIEELTNG